MTASDRALRSLDGLSVGDAFGEQFFGVDPSRIAGEKVPAAPWPWTDDTAMAIAIVECLLENGRIDQNALAARFARYFVAEPHRGYGAGAARLLARVASGEDWRERAGELFGGEGSWGNGGAMRVAPVGAYFADDMERVVAEARLAAEITHAHPEGQAGAVAVAVAAALCTGGRRGEALIEAVAGQTPEGVTREGLEKAATLAPDEPEAAAAELGTGQRVAVFDTVPWCVWVAAHHGDDFEAAMWTTVAGGGDMDTTCAIVGGIIGAVEAPPAEWIRRREALPPGLQP